MTITTLPEHLTPMVEKAVDAVLQPAARAEILIVSPGLRDITRNTLEKGILAFLNACLDGGVAREGIGCAVVSDWVATTGIHCNPDDFRALILNLGEAK